jgi:hypothetical protein
VPETGPVRLLFVYNADSGFFKMTDLMALILDRCIDGRISD